MSTLLCTAHLLYCHPPMLNHPRTVHSRYFAKSMSSYPYRAHVYQIRPPMRLQSTFYQCCSIIGVTVGSPGLQYNTTPCEWSDALIVGGRPVAKSHETAGCSTNAAASLPREEQPDVGQAVRLQHDPNTRLCEGPGSWYQKLVHLRFRCLAATRTSDQREQGLSGEQRAKVSECAPGTSSLRPETRESRR